MSQILEILSARAREVSRPTQSLQHGVVAGFDRGRYQVSAGGTTYLAESALGGKLKAGDRVLIALGRGTTRILGLLGQDAGVG